MTREEVKAMLPVLQAFAEGKTIESRCIKGDKSLWYDVEDPSFNNDFEYRIKPWSKYRSFANAEECWNEMKKHQPFGWVINKNTGRKHYITAIHETSNEVFMADDTWKDFYKIKKNYTFADGVPFGVKVEE